MIDSCERYCNKDAHHCLTVFQRLGNSDHQWYAVCTIWTKLDSCLITPACLRGYVTLQNTIQGVFLKLHRKKDKLFSFLKKGNKVIEHCQFGRHPEREFPASVLITINESHKREWHNCVCTVGTIAVSRKATRVFELVLWPSQDQKNPGYFVLLGFQHRRSTPFQSLVLHSYEVFGYLWTFSGSCFVLISVWDGEFNHKNYTSGWKI